MTDDLAFHYPDEPAASGAGATRRCRRHQWMATRQTGSLNAIGQHCRRCGAIRDEARVRRGRTNRSRGNQIEREIGARLGLRRVGMYGGPDDLTSPMFVAQVKSGGAFPERLYRWLKAVPTNAGQTALLVITDAPGPGHRRRALVVLDIDAWRDLHGSEEP